MSLTSTFDPQTAEAARQQMIAQQLRTWEVLDARVLDAIHSVKRENFVPESYRHVAFADAQIPIGHGQFMLQPKVDGKILQALAVMPGDEILDVGAGSGFLAACLGKLGGRVRSVELFPDLVERAKANVHAAAANNVVIELADAAQLNDENRYDAIAITAAIPLNNSELEQRFCRALKVGGRLFMVTGAAPVMEAAKITRTTQSHWEREELFETVFEPLLNASRPPAFTF
jgi:protein-L-isoaspartate(D-aspartate) O-methyltransferase